MFDPFPVNKYDHLPIFTDKDMNHYDYSSRCGRDLKSLHRLDILIGIRVLCFSRTSYLLFKQTLLILYEVNQISPVILHTV